MGLLKKDPPIGLLIIAAWGNAPGNEPHQNCRAESPHQDGSGLQPSATMNNQNPGASPQATIDCAVDAQVKNAKWAEMVAFQQPHSHLWI